MDESFFVGAVSTALKRDDMANCNLSNNIYTLFHSATVRYFLKMIAIPIEKTDQTITKILMIK
jgi:hypothetical protein